MGLVGGEVWGEVSIHRSQRKFYEGEACRNSLKASASARRTALLTCGRPGRVEGLRLQPGSKQGHRAVLRLQHLHLRGRLDDHRALHRQRARPRTEPGRLRRAVGTGSFAGVKGTGSFETTPATFPDASLMNGRFSLSMPWPLITKWSHEIKRRQCIGPDPARRPIWRNVMNVRASVIKAAIVFVWAALMVGTAAAQAFPSRAVTLIVPYPPAGRRTPARATWRPAIRSGFIKR